VSQLAFSIATSFGDKESSLLSLLSLGFDPPQALIFGLPNWLASTQNKDIRLNIPSKTSSL